MNDLMSESDQDLIPEFLSAEFLVQVPKLRRKQHELRQRAVAQFDLGPRFGLAIWMVSGDDRVIHLARLDVKQESAHTSLQGYDLRISILGTIDEDWIYDLIDKLGSLRTAHYKI